jgi:hypothetical protein
VLLHSVKLATEVNKVDRTKYINEVTKPTRQGKPQAVKEYELQMNALEIDKLKSALISEDKPYHFWNYNCSTYSLKALGKATQGSQAPISEHPGWSKTPVAPGDVLDHFSSQGKKRIKSSQSYVPASGNKSSIDYPWLK